MRNLKFAAGFAIAGFLLSLICGLLSHSTFLHKFVTALIFGIIFGLLGFLVQLIFNKFLLDEAPGEMNMETAVNDSSRLGQNVDLTIQDEELNSSDSENHFSVNSNRQMLNASDYSENPARQTVSVAGTYDRSGVQAPVQEHASVQSNEQTSANVIDDNNGFVPLRNKETYNSVSGTEAVAPADAGKSNGEGEIDVLPDMAELNFASDGSEDSEDEADADDGGFGSSFATTVSRESKEPEVDVKDAPLMAKAISSILSDEES